MSSEQGRQRLEQFDRGLALLTMKHGEERLRGAEEHRLLGSSLHHVHAAHREEEVEVIDQACTQSDTHESRGPFLR